MEFTPEEGQRIREEEAARREAKLSTPALRSPLPEPARSRATRQDGPDTDPLGSPGISTALWILGTLGIVAGASLLIPGIFEDKATDSLSGSLILSSGIMLIAIGSIIDRLHRIEIHLRPRRVSGGTSK